jgi:hypothetical protein
VVVRFELFVVERTLYQSRSGQAKINRMTSAVTPERDDRVVRMAMSSTEPEDGNQLPLPLEDGVAAPLSRVVPFGHSSSAAPRPKTRSGLEPPRGPLSEADVAHRRAMLEHLTRLSAGKMEQSA